MPPAHRLGTSNPDAIRSVRGRDGAVVGGWLVSVSSRPAPSAFLPDAPEAGTRATLRRPDPYFRPGACKRRRDVLMVLLCTLTVTGLVGVIPAMHILLTVTGFVGVVLLVYLGLLIRLRNHALEREVKLRYLPPSIEYDLPMQVRRVASR
jgi:hypothetical protein